MDKIGKIEGGEQNVSHTNLPAWLIITSRKPSVKNNPYKTWAASGDLNQWKNAKI